MRVTSSVKDAENPLNILSQSVPKSILVCADIATTMSRLASVNNDSLRNGEYMSVNASMSVKASLKSVL